jgi:LysM repeat protein
MDAFDDGSVVVGESTGFSKPILFGLVLGVVAIIVGAAGSYLGYSAGRDLDAFAAKLASEPDETQALAAKLNEIEEGLVKLGAETVRLSRQDRQLQDNIKAALEALQDSINSNRSTLNDLTERIGELASRPDSRRPGSASSSSSSAVEVSGDAEPPAGGTVTEARGGAHYVESGDTLSKIAKQYGVSLNDILKANPSVNPRALQIGQQIIIP